MRKKSPTLVCRLSISLTTKTLGHVVPAYNLQGPAVGRGKVAEAAQTTAQAEAPHAALAAQPATEAASDLMSAHRFPPPWSAEVAAEPLRRA
jgi:hypothetical protein